MPATETDRRTANQNDVTGQRAITVEEIRIAERLARGAGANVGGQVSNLDADVAAALGQVIELGPDTLQAVELGETVAQHLAARPAPVVAPLNPEVVEGLRKLAAGERCPYCGREGQP